MTDYTLKELAEGLRLEIDSKSKTEQPRPYLGMSQIGDYCPRKLWYSFRWAKSQTFTARQLRIFSRGYHEEPRLIKILESIGIVVEESQTPMEDCEAHFRGHLDAVLSNVPGLEGRGLGEFKAVKDSTWQNFNATGLLKNNQQYYAQCQIYSYYAELKWALFIAVNKDTEELYFEVILIDKKVVEKLQKRSVDIINSDEPLPRAFDSSKYFRCGWCEYKGICWENENYEKNCRTCKYSEPVAEGQWVCNLLGTILTLDVQRKGCDSYDSKQ